MPRWYGVGVQHPTQGWGGQRDGTFADQQHTVVAETRRALAAEAPNLVDADTAGTDGRDLPALVDVWGGHQHQGQPSSQEQVGP